MGEDRDFDLKERGDDGGANEPLVARVFRMGDKRNAARDHLRSRGLYLDRALRVRSCEGDAVVGAGPFAVLELGLGDGGAKVDVPKGWRDSRVDLAAAEHREEAALGDGLGPG